METIQGRPIKLKDHIAYSAGAIVSKTLHQKGVGNLTLFAFDAGQGLSEHTSPYDAIVEIIEGEARLLIGGNEVIARAGELVIMPAGIPHDVQAQTPFKMLLTMIRG